MLVRRIGAERHRHAGGRTEVLVLALSCGLLAAKLGEDLPQRLAHHVAQHVQAPAVRHADDHVVDALLRAAVDERLHAGDERLGALEAKALRGGVLVGEERLEHLGPREAVEHEALVVRREEVRPGELDALAQPVALLAVGDVHVLHAAPRRSLTTSVTGVPSRNV